MQETGEDLGEVPRAALLLVLELRQTLQPQSLAAGPLSAGTGRGETPWNKIRAILNDLLGGREVGGSSSLPTSKTAAG